MNRILYIAHFFPPIGGAGVQRSLKFIKHLPSYGILPTVLTSSSVSKNRWTPEDQSLLQEVPNEIPVVRVETPKGAASEKIRSWIEKGEMILAEDVHNLIFVSMSPFADAQIASELAKRSGLPWVADLRDPWALDEFQVHRTAFHRIRERKKMRNALETASLIIMNTPESSRRFQEAFPSIQARVVNITNGYDAEDFRTGRIASTSTKFTIVHSGYFHTEAGLLQRRRALEYRLLARVEHGVQFLSRSHYFLVQALEKWRKSEPLATEDVRVMCIGAMTEADRAVVKNSAVSNLFEFTEYLPHEACIKAMNAADLLFLPMHKLAPRSRATIVPGKTYEYMATGKPVLAAVPPGDARDFLTKAGSGLICEPDDVDGILKILKNQFQAWRDNKSSIQWNREYVETFERRELTRCLAAELNSLHKRRPDEKVVRPARAERAISLR